MAKSNSKKDDRTFTFHPVESTSFLVARPDGTVVKRFAHLGAWEIDGEVGSTNLYVCFGDVDKETGKPGKSEYRIPQDQMLQMRAILDASIKALGLEPPVEAEKKGRKAS
jgi:hypothetical protein